MWKHVVIRVPRKHRIERLIGPVEPGSNLSILQGVQQASVNIYSSLVERLNSPFEIIGQDLIVVIKRLIELCFTLRQGLSM